MHSWRITCILEVKQIKWFSAKFWVNDYFRSILQLQTIIKLFGCWGFTTTVHFKIRFITIIKYKPTWAIASVLPASRSFWPDRQICIRKVLDEQQSVQQKAGLFRTWACRGKTYLFLSILLYRRTHFDFLLFGYLIRHFGSIKSYTSQ
jgi:hypothetical protein